MHEAIRPLRKHNFRHPDVVEKELEGVVAQEPLPPHQEPDFIVLDDIVCYGANGLPFEQYEQINVMTDVVRYSDAEDPDFGKPKYLGYVDALLHIKTVDNGMFLPSYALQCAILERLYLTGVEKIRDGRVPQFEIKDDKPASILLQYGLRGRGLGMHNCNTIVDCIDRQIKHYPSRAELGLLLHAFPFNTGIEMIRLPFARNIRGGSRELSQALRHGPTSNYLKDLTGLKDPAILSDIARFTVQRHIEAQDQYYSPRPVKNNTTWIGGSRLMVNFPINSGGEDTDVGVLRGVK